MDDTVRYWSEISKKLPLISSHTPAGQKLIVATATIRINVVCAFGNN